MLNALGPEFFQRIVLAILIGALLGLEREYHKRQEIVGVRTFSLISLLGAVCAVISEKVLADYTLTFVGFAFVCGFAVILYINGLVKKKGMGFTTNVSLMMTYLLGVFAGFGFYTEAVFLGIVVAVILFSKEKMHHFVKRLTEREIVDLLEFLVILGIFYPIVPQQFAINGITVPLFLMWALIVLVASINFIAFLIARFSPLPHKIEVLGFFGGLADTSATSGSLASIYHQNKKLLYNVVAGVEMSAAALYIRNFAIMLVAAPYLYKYLGLPLALAVATLFIAAFFFSTKEKKHAHFHLKSPFNVMFAVKLGLGVFLLSIVLNMAHSLSSDLFLVAVFFGGMVSSLVATPSIAGMLSEGMISPELAAFAVIVTQVGSICVNMLILRMGKGVAVLNKSVFPIVLAISLSVLGLFASLYLW